tara:strand:- start:171 stop:1427 length:1257 start_codon:yes stop_codon:yes gene_type:complete
MKAHPRCEFFIYDGSVYYNNIPAFSGAISASLYGVDTGYISLYEYNIDRGGDADRNPLIYPFIDKSTARASFKTLSDTTSEFEWASASAGDRLYGTYPLSASITRHYITVPSGAATEVRSTLSPGEWVQQANFNKHYVALKNRLTFYGQLSQHFLINGSTTDADGTHSWNKSEQIINLINIPSIFYGSNIKPGSLSLKWYYTGSLAGELRDINHNGELIQVSGSSRGFGAPAGIGSVAGVALYNEGILLLTGSWILNDQQSAMIKDSSDTVAPKWIYFGAGAADGVTQGSSATSFNNVSFQLSFLGTSRTQVMTMFAHAKKGKVNYSNNPTFIKYGQGLRKEGAGQPTTIYEENPERFLVNTVSSSYRNHSASFKRQVYISQIGIYDDNKNLIGVATLSNPILKKEDENLTFKIKLDI